MDQQDLFAAVPKPQVARLKALGEGLTIGQVWGDRLLVKPITPFTDMDRVEKGGLLAIPDSVKQQNTPLPSSGIVVQVGLGEKVQEVYDLFEPGTAVLFSKYAGSKFVIDQVDYIILHMDEVMATLEVTAPIVEVATNNL